MPFDSPYMISYQSSIVTICHYKSTLYPRPILRTKRYCSTINYALLNFQQSCVSCVLFYIFTVLLFYWQCCLLISYIVFCCLHCDCLRLAAIKWFLTAFETLNLLTYLLDFPIPITLGLATSISSSHFSTDGVSWESKALGVVPST